MNRYAYHRPTTVDEARRLHEETPGARYIAGGTDVMIQVRRGIGDPPKALISLRNIAELGTIDLGDPIRIGAHVTIRDLVDHAELARLYPALHASARSLGSPQVRNVATIGGNLCKGSPAADLAPPLLVAEAEAEIIGPSSARSVPLHEFFVAPGETVVGRDEILTGVALPSPREGEVSRLMRRGRGKIDLATVSVAARLRIEEGVCRLARLSAGAVAPTPVRLRKSEALLQGQALTDGLLAEVAEEARAEVSPITDIRGTAEYRRHLVGVYVRRTLEALAADAAGEGG